MNDLPEKRGQSPFVRSTRRAVPANGDCPLFPVPPLNDELAGLLESLCLEELSTTDAMRLEELVSSDPDCCRQYIVFMQMHALAERFAGKWQADSSDESAVAHQSIPPLSTAHYPLPTSSIGGWAFSYIVASVVLCLMLLGGWAYKITSFEKSADNRPQTTAPGMDTQFVSVGQVTGMKDCVWAKDGLGTMVGASVPLSRKYAMISGLLEITYTSGARVILEGPCNFKVDSKIGGYLKLGKLTARVDNAKPQAVNPDPRNSSLIPHPSSFFSVTTPTAIVTDLGTEFGVDVDGSGNTTSHVFRGSVEVQTLTSPSGKGARGEGRVVLLANESVRVEKDGSERETHHAAGEKIEPVRFTHPTTPPKFVRRLYEPPKQLDLLDIVAGGNGLTARRERGIDPATGGLRLKYVNARCDGDGQYQPALWHRMIDGIFVPDGRNGKVQLDSAGHSFDGFPRTISSAWGSVWSRAMKIEPEQDDESWVYQITDVERFMPDGRGLLAFCPNVGLTFDLETVRKTYAESRPTRFHATAGLASSSRLAPLADGRVDLWIFVDGRLAFKRIGLARKDGPVELDVELTPADRFLTLVSTDGGDGISSDWLVLGEPTLKMTESTNSLPPAHAPEGDTHNP